MNTQTKTAEKLQAEFTAYLAKHQQKKSPYEILKKWIKHTNRIKLNKFCIQFFQPLEAQLSIPALEQWQIVKDYCNGKVFRGKAQISANNLLTYSGLRQIANIAFLLCQNKFDNNIYAISLTEEIDYVNFNFMPPEDIYTALLNCF